MKFVLMSLFFITSVARAQYDLKIKLIEKGTQLPLKELNVFILPDKIKGQTNSAGEAEFQNIATENSQIVVSAAGYLRLERSIQLSSVKQIMLYLEKESYAEFETIVTDTKTNRDQSQKTLSRKQFLEMPGANGDPLKAVQNLPGVNRTAGFSSQVVIQGSAPKDTAYDFEGHDIPIVFHFGGLSSVVMPEALEQVDYLSAGYQSDYSRALGGIISLKSRKPDVKERSTKGLFYFDNLSAGGLIESKIDEQSSFLISGRYSYIGFFLKSALKDNETLDLTVAPEFQDLTAIYNRDISADENFKLSLLGSRDRLAFVFDEPLKSDPSIRGAFSNTVNFYRLIPAWAKKADAENIYRLSLGLGQDEIGVEAGDQYFKLRSQVLTTRGEWENKISDNWTTQLGWDNQYSKAQVDLKLPLIRREGGVSDPISIGAQRTAQVSTKINNLGLYFKNDWSLNEKLSLQPGLRYDRFSQTNENFLSPRVAAKYKYTDDILLKAAFGQYVQAPEPQESSEDYGNPDIHSPKALHAMLGFESDLRQGSQVGSILSASVFDRWFDQLVIQSSGTVLRNGQSVFEVYNNNGRGRSYGLEAQWKFYQTDYNGFISYTFSKSTRWNSNQSEYNFEYDQTHNLNIVVAKPLANEWKISTRFRYVTGNPITPVIGATYDADNEVYIPKRGPIYSKRLKDFYQLDLRIDKKYVYDRSIWSYYLDIQNVLNTKNPESIQYSYDYASQDQISGLPILPALGIKGEF